MGIFLFAGWTIQSFLLGIYDSLKLSYEREKRCSDDRENGRGWLKEKRRVEGYMLT